MKNILIFSEKNFETAPRIIREINALRNDFNLFLCGALDRCGFPNYRNIYSFLSIKDKITNQLYKLIKKKSHPSFSRIRNLITEKNIEIVILHEAKFLPIFNKLNENNHFKIIFNAHEYHPLEFEDIPNWLETEGANYTKLYRENLPKIDLFINVCESIREKCLTEFRVDSIVIPNASSFRNLSIQTHKTPTIRLIHHGANLPSRKIENMIEIAHKLGDQYSLDLMLTSVKGCEMYDEIIRKKINETPNVFWKSSVNHNQISAEINTYDIGLFYLEPSNFNYKFALPNKLFEFIQARLAIAVSPSPEMKNLVQKYELGVCSDDFSIDSMVNKISQLTLDDIQRFKQNSHKAACIENAEKYDAIYLDKVVSLFNN